MKRIINILEEDYNWIKEHSDWNYIRTIIANSTPLNEVESNDCISKKDVIRLINDGLQSGYIGADVDWGELLRDIDDLPTVYPKNDKPNTVSEEVYTQEYIARKVAEFEVYRLKKQLEMLKLDRECDKPSGKWGKDGECPYCGYIQQWDDDVYCGHCGAKLGSEDKGDI